MHPVVEGLADDGVADVSDVLPREVLQLLVTVWDVAADFFGLPHVVHHPLNRQALILWYKDVLHTLGIDPLLPEVHEILEVPDGDEILLG